MDLVSLDSPGETEFVASFLNQGSRLGLGDFIEIVKKFAARSPP